MWVADFIDNKIYAYTSPPRRENTARNSTRYVTPTTTTHDGIWSNGTTMWVSTILATTKSTPISMSIPLTRRQPRLRQPDRLQRCPYGIGLNGETTVWVSRLHRRQKAVRLQPGHQGPRLQQDFTTHRPIAGNSRLHRPHGPTALTMWVSDSADRQGLLLQPGRKLRCHP